MKGDFPLADLPIFLAVARHGSMTRAALALHTVQSNVSARIRRLEEALGATLVVREPRGLRLTADGETLLREARRIEALREKILRHFGVAAEAGPGVFRIGGIETFTHTHMERILTSFTRSCPGVDLIVETGSSAMLSQRVLKGELDAAFVSRRTHDPCSPRSVSSETNSSCSLLVPSESCAMSCSPLTAGSASLPNGRIVHLPLAWAMLSPPAA